MTVNKEDMTNVGKINAGTCLTNNGYQSLLIYMKNEHRFVQDSIIPIRLLASYKITA